MFSRQLSEILAYADQVRQVDTSGVPPTAHIVTLRAADRPDEVRESLSIEDAIGTAPDADSRAGFFKVPRIIG
jgi:aspartyl-tRNA(Asn)/glutamyl-tRNA(Gln) amidotransferase subunit C